MTKIFYDSEFTGLHQRTTLISMGLSSECGREFYAEFADYDRSQCDRWIEENVLVHTRWLSVDPLPPRPQRLNEERLSLCFGDSADIREALRDWLAQFEAIEIWADCLAWDWVLFCELFGGAFGIPGNVFFMPGDLATAFRLRGLDPDTDRERFAGIVAGEQVMKHNALWDARVIKACYWKLGELAEKGTA